MFSNILYTITLLLLSQLTAAASDVVFYWGQGSGQGSLASYCDTADIIIISFVTGFSGSSVQFSFGNSCSGTTCSTIATDIQTCQSKGVKILLSVGGSASSISIGSSSEASNFVDGLYTSFGPKGTVFPGATVDGIDLDLESGSLDGLSDFIDGLKDKFGSDFLVTAAPQCPIGSVSYNSQFNKQFIEILKSNGKVDKFFIQFYNNIQCNFASSTYASSGSSFNDWVKEFPNTELYVGLPGSSTSAGSGFVDIATITSAATSIVSASNFGGFMFWQASTVPTSMISGIKSLIGGSSGSIEASAKDASISVGGVKAAVATTGLTASAATTHAHNAAETQFVTVDITVAGVTTRETTTINPGTSGASTGASTASTPTSMTTEPTISQATLITSQPTLITSQPTLITSQPTLITTEPTLQTNIYWAATASSL